MSSASFSSLTNPWPKSSSSSFLLMQCFLASATHSLASRRASAKCSGYGMALTCSFTQSLRNCIALTHDPPHDDLHIRSITGLQKMGKAQNELDRILNSHNGLHCLPALNGTTDALGNFPRLSNLAPSRIPVALPR